MYTCIYIHIFMYISRLLSHADMATMRLHDQVVSSTERDEQKARPILICCG